MKPLFVAVLIKSTLRKAADRASGPDPAPPQVEFDLCFMGIFGGLQTRGTQQPRSSQVETCSISELIDNYFSIDESMSQSRNQPTNQSIEPLFVAVLIKSTLRKAADRDLGPAPQVEFDLCFMGIFGALQTRGTQQPRSSQVETSSISELSDHYFSIDDSMSQ